jgi:hypothetical protein
MKDDQVFWLSLVMAPLHSYCTSLALQRKKLFGYNGYNDTVALLSLCYCNGTKFVRY